MARRGKGPFGVGLVEFGPRVHHLGFDPQAKSDTSVDCGGYDRTQAPRQLLSIVFPITKALRIGDSRVFVAEPTVVQEEHFRTQRRGVVDDRDQPRLVEFESGGLPIVPDDRSGAVAVAHLLIGDPTVKSSRQVAAAIDGPAPYDRRCGERFVWGEGHLGAV